MFSLANTYAKLKKTTIIAYDLKEDGTIVFVLEAGGKYKMTREELEKAIEELSQIPPQAGTPDLPTSTQAGDSPFDYIEEAVEEIKPQPKRRKTRS